MRKTRIFLACLLIMMLFAFVGCGNDDGAMNTEGDTTDAGQNSGAENRNDDNNNDGTAGNAGDAIDNMTTSGGGADNNQNSDTNNNQVNQ